MDYDVTRLPIADIFNDTDFNCRGVIAPIDVVTLAKDIKERGLDTPITVQPYDQKEGKKWRIVAGHRRYTAFTLLNRDQDSEVAEKHSTIPCFVKLDFDETTARTYNLRENLHRVPLNILQEARHLKYYFDKHISDRTIAEMTGQNSNWVNVRKCLLALPPDVQEVAAAGLITQEQIKAASKIKNMDRLYEYIRKLKEKKATGDKVDVLPPIQNKKDHYKARKRTPPEIRQMLNYVYDAVGPSVVTRVLAWINGDITTVAVYEDLRQWSEEQGLTFELPEEIKAAITGESE